MLNHLVDQNTLWRQRAAIEDPSQPFRRHADLRYGLDGGYKAVRNLLQMLSLVRLVRRTLILVRTLGRDVPGHERFICWAAVRVDDCLVQVALQVFLSRGIGLVKDRLYVALIL